MLLLELEWRRRLLPAASVMLASIVTTLPAPLAWSVMPNFALLLVIIWASVQPRLMPVWAAFLLGLVHDLVAGGPFGISGLLFALAVAVVRVGEGRLEARWMAMDWLMAGMLVALAHGVLWLLLPLAGVAAPADPILLQAALTIAAFPAVLALAAMLHRRLAEPGA
jgi:rod shape-determining protein MreD